MKKSVFVFLMVIFLGGCTTPQPKNISNVCEIFKEREDWWDAINSATFIGYRVAGIPGSVLATLGVLLIPILIVILLWIVADRFYHSSWIQGALLGLKPALVALIFYSAWSIGRVAFDSSGPILLALGAYAVLRFSRLHPAFIIAASGLVGFLFL